jgi:hypothetical protein
VDQSTPDLVVALVLKVEKENLATDKESLTPFLSSVRLSAEEPLESNPKESPALAGLSII